jgi:hypothetical protein
MEAVEISIRLGSMITVALEVTGLTCSSTSSQYLSVPAVSVEIPSNSGTAHSTAPVAAEKRSRSYLHGLVLCMRAYLSLAT